MPSRTPARGTISGARRANSTYNPAHWLTVGPYDGVMYDLWTTLTLDDLANPKLWTLRSVRAWAEALIVLQTKSKASRPPLEGSPDAEQRPARGDATRHFNRAFGSSLRGGGAVGPGAGGEQAGG